MLIEWSVIILDKTRGFYRKGVLFPYDCCKIVPFPAA